MEGINAGPNHPSETNHAAHRPHPLMNHLCDPVRACPGSSLLFRWHGAAIREVNSSVRATSTRGATADDQWSIVNYLFCACEAATLRQSVSLFY